MKISPKFKKALGSSIFYYQAIGAIAIAVILFISPSYPGWKMLGASVISLAVLVLNIASGFKTDEQVTSKSIPGGGLPPPDGNDDDGNP